ncbi:hypothetical protein, partial [Streptococcus pneumoniae]|uniref:hypothetical protein n=1 Tax=Streptococcus pneumoniae TaxID=1313 RepID=UPI001E2F49D4
YDIGDPTWEKFDIRNGAFKEAMARKLAHEAMPQPGAFEWGAQPPPPPAPPPAPTLQDGIDLSDAQSAGINWEAAWAAGNRFAYIRASVGL